MGTLDFLTGPLRSLLGVAEQAGADIEHHVPTAQLERRLEEAVTAVHRAAESMEGHVAAIESLTDSLPPLTESVTRLTDQLTALMKVTAPVAAAEREFSRIERLFGRRRQVAPGPAAQGAATAPAQAEPAGAGEGPIVRPPEGESPAGG